MYCLFHECCTVKEFFASPRSGQYWLESQSDNVNSVTHGGSLPMSVHA